MKETKREREKKREDRLGDLKSSQRIMKVRKRKTKEINKMKGREREREREREI